MWKNCCSILGEIGCFNKVTWGRLGRFGLSVVSEVVWIFVIWLASCMTALLAPHQSPNMSNYSQEETRAKLKANAACYAQLQQPYFWKQLTGMDQMSMRKKSTPAAAVTYNVFFSKRWCGTSLHIIMLFICEDYLSSIGQAKIVLSKLLIILEHGHTINWTLEVMRNIDINWLTQPSK